MISLDIRSSLIDYVEMYTLNNFLEMFSIFKLA